MLDKGSQAVLGLPPAGNRYTADAALTGLIASLLGAEARGWAEPLLRECGEEAAGALNDWAQQANRHPPTLHRRDRYGNSVDEIEFHPDYHRLRQASYGKGIVGNYYDPAVTALLGEGREVVKFAQGYIFSQAEQGLYCPICLTDGTAFMIDSFGSKVQKERFLPRLTSRNLDFLWEGAMFLTEKAGGSDVGATETVARPNGDGTYSLFGEKWFCSNAGAELAMVLARCEGAQAGTAGLTLFAMRRHNEDGSLNNQSLVRLKDKLGTRSMPTGELVLEGAIAEPVGDPGSGFKQMAEMLNLSRLYNATASLAVCRRALSDSLSWARQRRTFGQPVVSHAPVRLTIVEMAVEQEAALRLLFSILAARGRALSQTASAQDRHLMRIATPLIKYSTARLAVRLAAEAMEIYGGNGYIEDWPLARLMRDALVLPIWEGTTNMLVIDTMRALKQEAAREALALHVRGRTGESSVLAAFAELSSQIEPLVAGETPAHLAARRRFCDRLVEILQACALEPETEDDRLRAVSRNYWLRHFAGDRQDLSPASDRDSLAIFELVAGD